MIKRDITKRLNRPSRPYDIVGLGALNVDLIVEDPEGKTEDSEGVLPRERILTLGQNGRPFLGGSAFNVLSLLGRINSVGDAPLRLAMIGAAGSISGYGLPTHNEVLERLNISSLIENFEDDSGLCVSLASSTGRKLFVDPGANYRIAEFLTDKNQREILIDSLQDCRILHLTSLLDREGENKVAKAVLSFLKDIRARNKSVIISFDPGDPWVKAVGVQAIKGIFELADIIFLNEQEFSALTNSVPSDISAIRTLSRLCPKTAVHILKDYRSVKVVLPSGILVASIPQTDLVDTVDPTAAGDAFASGVLFAIASKRSLYDGAKLGLKMAALCVSDIGNQGYRDIKKQIGNLWSEDYEAEAVTKVRFLETLTTHASSIRTIAEAVIAVGLIIAGLLTIPDKVKRWIDVSYDYVATPKVVAYQYAFPDKNTVSSADGLMAYGQHVRIKCRKKVNGDEILWLQLESGRWVMGSEFTPAGNEKGKEELPECP